MKFIETINLALGLCSGSIALLGANRIFTSFVPAAQAMPYAVISDIQSIPIAKTLGYKDSVRLATFQLSIVSTTIGQSAGICNKFRTELQGALGTPTNGMKVNWINIEGENFQWDPGDDATEAGAFVCVLTIKMYYTAEEPLPINLSGI